MVYIKRSLNRYSILTYTQPCVMILQFSSITRASWPFKYHERVPAWWELERESTPFIAREPCVTGEILCLQLT